MGIDWSKAPSWAKTVGKNGWNELAWLSDKGYSYFIGNGGFVDFTIPRAFKSEDFTIVSFRPFESVWNGEGFPPVGCEIEAMLPALNEWFWQIAKVVHGPLPESPTEILVFSLENTKPCWVDKFRPIRSAEQIAQDARQKAIFEIGDILIANRGNSTEYHQAGLIYDAGWRKQASE